MRPWAAGPVGPVCSLQHTLGQRCFRMCRVVGILEFVTAASSCCIARNDYNPLDLFGMLSYVPLATALGPLSVLFGVPEVAGSLHSGWVRG